MSKDTVIPYFNAKVEKSEQGKFFLTFPNQKMLQQYLVRFYGKAVQVSIRKPRKLRSNDQNAYYWAVVVGLIAEHTGMTIDEAHEALKIKFLLRPKVIKKAGKTLGHFHTVRSTATLGIAEFSEYIENIRTFAATELGITIPDATKVDTERL